MCCMRDELRGGKNPTERLASLGRLSKVRNAIIAKPGLNDIYNPE